MNIPPLVTRPGFWLVALLSLHGALLAWSATRQAPTIDEPFHLAAGLRRLTEGKFDVDAGNTPLPGDLAALGALTGSPRYRWSTVPKTYRVGIEFLKVNGDRAFWLILLGRWALIPVSLLGGYLCFRWSNELFGSRSALLAAGLWCFSPSILGNGSLITGDVSAATFSLLAVYLFWRWLQRPTLAASLAAGVGLGLALLSKYVCVVLVVLLPLLWLMVRGWQVWTRAARPAWWTSLGQLLLVLVLGVELVNCAYHFRGAFAPLGQSAIGRRVAGYLPESTRPALHRLPVPLPAPYLDGVGEISKRVNEAPRTYLGGQWRAGGFWHYYLYAYLVKLPDGTLLLLGLSAVLLVICRSCRSSFTSELALLLPIVGIILFVSLVGTGQRFRYALPALPFLLVFASRAAMPLPRLRRLQGVMVSLAAASVAISSLLVYPHSLSYFNWSSGGPRNGDAHLVDSNIDWGQDLFYLKDWLDHHPEARPLSFVYFGCLDPAWVGIRYQLPPKFHDDVGQAIHVPYEEQGPQPGWYAVSVGYHRGVPWAAPTGRGGVEYMRHPYFKYFRQFEPIARAGYSIHIYHITADEADRVRKRLGLPPLKRRGT